MIKQVFNYVLFFLYLQETTVCSSAFVCLSAFEEIHTQKYYKMQNNLLFWLQSFYLCFLATASQLARKSRKQNVSSRMLEWLEGSEKIIDT